MDPAMLRFGGADECLRGHAADVHAGPAQYPTFRDRDAGAEVCSFDRCGESCRAAPNDQEVQLPVAPRNHSRRIGAAGLVIHARTVPSLRHRALDTVRRRLRPRHDPRPGIRVTHLEYLADSRDRLERFRDGPLAMVACHAGDLDGQFS